MTPVLSRSAKALGAVLATLLAAGAASAADVSIYGRIDTGLVYQSFSGDSVKNDSFTMESGPNTASRWGIQGSEKLTDDLTVGFRLENRFASDSGELKGDRLFEGTSFVQVKSNTWGEVAAGRISGIGSGSGPYDLQFFMDAFGGGTLGTGLAPVKSSRMDNMITVRTPMLAGVQGTFQHSLKMDNTVEGADESTSDADRFWAGGLRWNVGALNMVAVYEETTWGHKTETAPDHAKKVVTLGGSYRTGDVMGYLQAQYFDGVNALDGFKVADMRDLEGYGIYAGAQVWFGLSSLQTMVYVRDYDVKARVDGRTHDASSKGIAAKYIWRPSKTIDIYVGGGYAEWDRLSSGKILTDKSFNAFSGVTKYF